jgi:sterol desaturase/sphingolipid hydroxylase (fatty acid hydroxylase superfamily)
MSEDAQQGDGTRKAVLEASPRLFESDILDKLSRVHPATPVVVYAPVVAVLLWWSLAELPLSWASLCFALGLTAWTLTEYLGHRLLFHTVFPLPFGLGPRLQFLIHGVHHVHPSDPLRLVMPPLLSAPIVSIAYAISRLIVGPDLVWPVVAGFIVGYVAYDCTHFWLHHAQPRSALMRRLRALHMAHHFRDESKAFGVMSFWWDYVFGTAYKKG